MRNGSSQADGGNKSGNLALKFASLNATTCLALGSMSTYRYLWTGIPANKHASIPAPMPPHNSTRTMPLSKAFGKKLRLTTPVSNGRSRSLGMSMYAGDISLSAAALICSLESTMAAASSVRT